MDVTETATSHEAEALRIVNAHMGWAAGAGLLPIPMVDLAAITGVQIKMIHALSGLYGVPFSRDTAKSVIAALIGSGGAAVLAGPASSLVKAVPVVGSIAGVLTAPALAAAATYALGKVFIQHYETGGNLLNLNPQDMKRYYQEYFEASKAKNAKAASTKAG